MGYINKGHWSGPLTAQGGVCHNQASVSCADVTSVVPYGTPLLPASFRLAHPSFSPLPDICECHSPKQSPKATAPHEISSGLSGWHLVLCRRLTKEPGGERGARQTSLGSPLNPPYSESLNKNLNKERWEEMCGQC